MSMVRVLLFSLLLLLFSLLLLLFLLLLLLFSLLLLLFCSAVDAGDGGEDKGGRVVLLMQALTSFPERQE